MMMLLRWEIRSDRKVKLYNDYDDDDAQPFNFDPSEHWTRTQVLIDISLSIIGIDYYRGISSTL